VGIIEENKEAKTMRFVYLFTFCLGITIVGNSQTKLKDYSIIMQNEVKSIELTVDSPSTVKLTITLTQEVVNDGKKPVIFLRDSVELRGISLGKTPNTYSPQSKLTSEYYGESVNTSLKWKKFQNYLDKPYPPSDKTRILMPNESMKSKSVVNIAFPKETNKGNFSDERESWANIKQLATIWMQTSNQVWSLNLEISSKGRDELRFGKKLQKRWKKYGYLWLDGIVSEPVRLDLSSAIVKTQLKP
jgi:hypothetical protein